MDGKWIALFSQTGKEIVDISTILGRWPDVIITNQRPSELRTINQKILDSGKLITLPNKPSEEELENIFGEYEKVTITLHGWLRIIPANLCKKYNIFNGHPGLITDFPELKGKDPQIRAFKEKYPVMGCVIHKVSPGVDEGEIVLTARFGTLNMTEKEMWYTMRDRTLGLWRDFFSKLVE